MNKECIFKASAGNEWWYLYRYPNEKAVKGYVYRVYRGRKWDDHISWFSYEIALGQLLRCCLSLYNLSVMGAEQ